MNYIIRDNSTGEIIDVFEDKHECVGFVQEICEDYNKDNPEEPIRTEPTTIGECITLLKLFDYILELR